MARLRRRQRRRNRFRVAHLAHQNHVRRLTHDAAQGHGEIRRVAPHFDLLDNRAAVGVLILYRVFDGHHVRRALGIHDIDQRGERRALAAPRRACHQHQPLPALGQLGQRQRQMQRFQRRNARRQQSYAGRQRAALMMDVDTEAPQVLAHETQVHALALLQLLQLRRLQQRENQASHVVRLQHGARSRCQIAGHAQHRGRSRNQQDVRRAAPRRCVQKLVQGRRRLPGPRGGVLLARRRPVQLGYNLR